MSVLIKRVRLLNPKNSFDGITDILIEGSRIARISESIEANGAAQINAEGMWAMPGLIDVHCHLREPGYEHKETIESGAKSAAIGGFTTICAMPNTFPPAHSAEVIEYIVDKAKKAVVNVLPIGAITKGMDGAMLTDFSELKKSGICAVSEDGKTVEDSWVMLKAMLSARENSLPVLCHCEDKSVSPGGVMNEGAVAEKLGVIGISDKSEESIIARDLELQDESGAHLHICHVATKGAVELIRSAKSEGRSVTSEVCPHHFSLTDKTVLIHGANAKMAPPLRDSDDVFALIKALSDGTIDIIATDHAPHHSSEKATGITDAPFGIVGFETALPLAITNLINNGFLTPLQLAEKMSLNPARLLGLERGSIEENSVADLIVIDPDYDYEVDIEKFQSKSNNCPYGGMKLKGKVFANIISGNIIVDNYKGVWEC